MGLLSSVIFQSGEFLREVSEANIHSIRRLFRQESIAFRAEFEEGKDYVRMSIAARGQAHETQIYIRC